MDFQLELSKNLINSKEKSLKSSIHILKTLY